jgi:hypothetical protein
VAATRRAEQEAKHQQLLAEREAWRVAIREAEEDIFPHLLPPVDVNSSEFYIHQEDQGEEELRIRPRIENPDEVDLYAFIYNE